MTAPTLTPAAHALLLEAAKVFAASPLKDDPLRDAARAFLAEQAKREAERAQTDVSYNILQEAQDRVASWPKWKRQQFADMAAPEPPAVTVSERSPEDELTILRARDIGWSLEVEELKEERDNLAAENARLKSKYENPSNPYPWQAQYEFMKHECVEWQRQCHDLKAENAGLEQEIQNYIRAQQQDANRIRDLTARLAKYEHQSDSKKPAYWTHERINGDGGHLYYFAPNDRHKPPYLTQLHVKAIIDVATDGTLAGVELIDPKMPPPPAALKGLGK